MKVETNITYRNLPMQMTKTLGELTFGRWALMGQDVVTRLAAQGDEVVNVIVFQSASSTRSAAVVHKIVPANTLVVPIERPSIILEWSERPAQP